ncbi:MAG TPA: SGNH/GDSL hydrolase family protein [Gammaproteobacteria bacterium]|nr:SGNH/GDSL hydrolase family protein [Gammaproteobacteria bacterium]
MKKIFLFVFLWFLSGSLFAAIDEMVFFGDSLTDNGNLYRILKFIPRSPPYYEGRFSNGPTWAETVAQHYEKTFDLPYTIYAYGGATALAQAPTAGDQFFTPITLQGEIYEFYLASLFSDKSNKLYVIWIGANDYLMDKETDVDTLTSQVVDQISEGVFSLIGKGARYFLILNLPDLGSPPYAEINDLKDRLHSLSEMHNEKLAKAIEGFNNLNSNIKVLSLDAYGIFNDLLVNTKKYNEKYKVNLTVLNKACWQGGLTFNNRATSSLLYLKTDLQNKLLANQVNDSAALTNQVIASPGLKEAYLKGRMRELGLNPCSNPDQYVFWDLIHPTEVVHQILSAITIENIDSHAKDLFS